MLGKFKQLLLRHLYPKPDMYTREYIAYFNRLFSRAARTSGFQYLCTVLRVEGIKSGHWDAFVEAEDAANDFSKFLRSIRRKGREKQTLRMGLFLYSHLTEMSATYEILANLLRCIQGKPYSMFPFAHLISIEKKRPSIFAKRHLPYPISKIKHLRELSKACDEQKLLDIIEGFFSNDIRNAFYHSDYAISDKEFRIIEGGEIGKQSISLEELSEKLQRCFAFYSAFFMTYNSVRKGLAQGAKYIRWPNYEVLEVLSDKEGLTGFKIHFPHGSYAMFERKKYKGTEALNIMLEERGITLMVGDLDKYKKAENWCINGKPFEEYGTRYNQYGFWRPIVFSRDGSKVQKKVIDMTGDKTAQGLLFYIYTTGYAAIEFVIAASRPLFRRQKQGRIIIKKRIEIFLCKNAEGQKYIYDGTYFLSSKEVSEVKSALEKISGYMQKLQKKDNGLKYRLKYQIYSDGSEGKMEENENGSFKISLCMDDPRSTLVASDLGIFPKTDWHIKEEWI